MSKLSIVTITYNNLAGLSRTRESVAKVNIPECEHVIIDGGSTDGTVDYLKELAGVDHWSSEKDDGPYDAMNKGVRRASGEWVMFLNAGDTLASPEALGKLLTAAESSDAGLAYGDHIYKGRSRPAKSLDSLHTLLMAGDVKGWLRGHPCHQAVIARRQLLLDMPFDLSFRIAADFHWMERVRSQGTKSLKIDALICVYQAGGLSSKDFPRCNVEWWKVAKLAGGQTAVCKNFFLDALRKHNRRKQRAGWADLLRRVIAGR